MDKYGGPKQTGKGNGAHAKYLAVANSLANIFGKVMERDALFAVVESCDGDQSRATDVLLDITGQKQPAVSGYEKPQCSTSHSTASNYQQPNVQQPHPQQSLSYCNVTKAPGTSFNQNNQKIAVMQKDKFQVPIWPEDLRRIFYYHNEGFRTLILLRGLPGSGKSYLAQQIIEMTIGPGPNHYNNHVFSSDDFFYVNGKYCHNKERLTEAHDWNKKRVQSNLLKGRSPIIVDNTNVKFWEMEWYTRAGVQEGYYIEIIEPTTSWAWKPNYLFKRNKHNVPYETINRMYDRFDPSISGQEYIRKLNLKYPSDKLPPMQRFIPIVERSALPSQIHVESNQDNTPAEQSQQIPILPSLQSGNLIVDEAKDDGDSRESNEGINLEKYAVVAKKLEEFEMIDKEWEKCGHWDDQSSQASQSADKKGPQGGPMPQRNKEQLFPTVSEFQDWSILIPPWQQNIPPATKAEPSPVETRSSITCIEFGDTDHYNPKFKVVTGTPRDININYMPPMTEKHNAKMFDKSTTTSDEYLSSVKVKNEEKLFRKFRNMFRTIPRNDLKDIFDKCGGDVSWAVEMVIDGIPLREDLGGYVSSDPEISDQEDDENYIPTCSVKTSVTANKIVVERIITENKEAVAQSPKRGKKDKSISESSLNLKRQIEKNIVMPDKFYSDHTIRLRKGVVPEPQSNPEGEGTSKDIPCNNSSSEKDSSDNESATNDTDENVTFNLGHEFVQNLDRLFERREGNWEGNIVMPLVNMPMSILNQINALWLESLAYQVESQAAYSKLMLKQDEEFARQLAEKEEELNRAGQEPVVPDLKEIMDMDLACSLYQKDVAQWKNRAPKDWAAKMTLEKLVNLFPGIPEETLCEMLMAHDNSFQATVETLLLSTGQSSVLEQDNGVNKFVMEGEMKRQTKVIEAEKQKQLDNAEWPVLTKLENVDMETVQSYRNDAFTHMSRRKANYDKAQDYIRRGMTQIAGVYSQFASIQMRLFEQANCMAATALIHLNQANNAWNTLDLHYLHVSEALQTLDLYIDHHIQILQEQRCPLKKCLFIITGRGLHSERGPKIKPAVIKRLIRRGFRFCQLNPGLVSIKLTKNSKMTHQL